MSDPFGNFGDMLGQQMEQLQNDMQKSAEEVQGRADVNKKVQEAMFQRLAGANNAKGLEKLPQQLQEIVAVTSTQPKMLAWLHAQLQKKIAEVNAAIDQIFPVDTGT